MIEIRASALSDFTDCAARAEAKHLLGLKMPSGGAAQLGTAIHASTAVYDQGTLDGAGITPNEAFGAAVDAIYHPQQDVVWDDDDSQKGAEKIAAALHAKYCAEIAPTQSYAAVEVKCERLEISDLNIALTGTTDRIRKADDGYGIGDLKTGKTAVGADGTVKTSGHAVQIGVYELLVERASGLPITTPAQIIAMQTGKTEKGQRIGIGTVVGARELLVGEEDSPGVLQIVARMIEHGDFFGNPRSMLCGEKFCPIFYNCKWRK